MNVQHMRPDLSEARRLLDKGFKLCKLQPHSKAPEGKGWNVTPTTEIDPAATGYGLPLAVNRLCSVDPDNADLARRIMQALGFDLDEIMNAGVRTHSTRQGSGGRSAFKAADGLGWCRFAFKGAGTVLELRASSPNLQDALPGVLYATKDGELCTQTYANGRRLDEAPPLPQDFAAWWRRLSTDLAFYREQQAKAAAAIGDAAFCAVSLALHPRTGSPTPLAFQSPYRQAFNTRHDVAELLAQHGYTDHGLDRFAPPTATGSPGVRPIAGRDGLWQSDHASDPLHGTFDAWTAFVVLTHGGDLAAAENAALAELHAEALDDFEVIDTRDTRARLDAIVGDLWLSEDTREALRQVRELLPEAELSEAETERTVDRIASDSSLTADEVREALGLPPPRRYDYDVRRLKPTEFVIDGFMRTGLTVIAGAPGVGKTSLIVPLAAIAAHLIESPLRPVLRRKVVYVAEEPEQVESVLFGLAAHAPGAKHGGEFNEWFTLLNSRRVKPAELGKALARAVKAHTVIQNGYPVAPLVVLDTSNANIEILSENDNSEVGRAIAAIKENIGRGACWLIAHTPKALKRADVDEMTTRGASAFTGDANATAYVFREDAIDDRRFMRLDKRRFEAEFLELEFTTETRRATVETPWGTTQDVAYRFGLPARGDTAARIEARERAQEQADRRREATARQELTGLIQQFIRDHGPASKNAIETGVRRNRIKTREALAEMLASGVLRFEGGGTRGLIELNPDHALSSERPENPEFDYLREA